MPAARPGEDLDPSGDHAFLDVVEPDLADLVTEDDQTSPHSLSGAPLKVRLILVGVLSLISALFFGIGGWALLPSTLPSALVTGGWLVLGLMAVTMVVTAIKANSGRADDGAARVAHALLGLGWLLFVWGLIAVVGRTLLIAFGLPVAGVSIAAAGGTAGLVGVLVVTGYRAATGVPGIRRVAVPISGLTRPVTVAMITDTHFDAWTSRGWAEGIVAAINREQPDIVVHTGDLADGSVTQRGHQVSALAQVSAPTRAYIAGNHEYYSDAPAWTTFMAEQGWQVLVNEHLVHEQRLVVAGLDDPTGTAMAGRGPDIDQALAGAPDLPVLLLAHQPHQVRDALDRVDLQLSGHTHGGQIWPFHYLVRLREPVVAGLASVTDRTRLYVSRGSGFWGPPLRVFAPSEIAILTLTPAPPISS